MGDLQAIRLLKDSLSIYSPSGEEAPYGDFLREAMATLGYSDIRTDSTGNVLGEIGSGPHSLLLCGHMDTVPGPIDVRFTKTHAVGRGASDAKAPLCALLLAGARSADSGVNVTFAAVTREETDSQGVKTLLASGRRFDCAVFGEPSGAGRLVVGYRGRLEARVTVSTAGGHAGAPWSHGSAFEAFLSILERLRRYETANSVEGDHFNSLSITPTVVASGSDHNVLPRSCETILDIRLPPSISCAAARAGIRKLVSESPAGSSSSVTFDESTEPFEARRDSPVVRAFQRAVITKLGARPVFSRKTGTGDMNVFARGSPADCVTYGPGDPGVSHTTQERVSLRDYLDSIVVVEEAIRQLGAISSP